MNHYLENDAVLSECGKYRYLLRRTWDHKKPRALYIMLNPSTADGRQDDATIRSCVRLASGLGYGSMEVVNVFAWRATKPTDLPSITEAIGANNPDTIDGAISRCDVVICAWGANAMAMEYGKQIVSTALASRPAVYCFGKTQSGAPKHPLYIKSGTPLEVFG